MKKVKNMVVAAIVLAIAFIFLYLAATLPSGRIACLCISTACLCITLMESGIKTGILSSVVLSVLGYLFVPDKLVAILFIMFFSYYPVLKLLVERKNNMIVEWIIKGIFFVIISVIGINIMKFAGVLPSEIENMLNGSRLFIAVLAISLCGAVFDYALSLLIGFYMKRIMPVINKNYR